MEDLEDFFYKLLEKYKKKEIVIDILKNKRTPEKFFLLGDGSIELSPSEQEELLDVITKTKRDQKRHFLRKKIKQKDERLKNSLLSERLKKEEENEFKDIKKLTEERYQKLIEPAIISISNIELIKRKGCIPINCPIEKMDVCDEGLYYDRRIKEIEKNKRKLTRLRESNNDDLINNAMKLNLEQYDECIKINEQCWKEKNEILNKILRKSKKRLDEIDEQIAQMCPNPEIRELAKRHFKEKKEK